MSEEMREALEAVIAADENERRRQGIEAFCEAVRTEPHAECVEPLFITIIYVQMSLDTDLVELSETGSMLLAVNDD